MRNSKLDALLWEQMPFDNLIIQGNSVITQENLDYIPFEDIDELCLSRDDDYNIKISCVRRLNRTKNEKQSKAIADKQIQAGEVVPVGKITIKVLGNIVEISPCYYNGDNSNMERVEYNLVCYHVESRNNEKSVVLKEWILNGSKIGIGICGNSTFEYSVDEETYGEYGDFEFPVKKAIPKREYQGRFTHIKYKDTAFDIHFVGDDYGPKWSNNFSISYFDKYGRIPDMYERNIIRDYLSFFMGKQLFYIGNSSYDDKGNQIGFVMESPLTFGFDIERICRKAEKPPIKFDYNERQTYFDTVQKHINKFSEIYSKLELNTFFSGFWYAENMARPMNLTILSASLESLKKLWYENVELNPETVLMDKKEFKRLFRGNGG